MMRLIANAVAFVWVALTGASVARRGLSSREPDADDRSAEERRPERRTSWKVRLVKLSALLLVLALGGFLFAASGIMPIKASSGHWAITAWFLNFSMARSVSTHSLTIKVPQLDDPALVLKGAGHYDLGCRACHGSPDLPHPRIAGAMTPHPPYLPPKISEWEAEELFYIVKHGVKFTGMPAWPTQRRDDEVWAMVAFLRKFPELNTAEYRRLVGGELDSELEPLEGLSQQDTVPRAAVERCGRCHGRDGSGRGTGAFPRLAGQSPTYLELSLQAFASGERHSGIMEPIAAALTPEEMRVLSRYYGGLDPQRPQDSDQKTAAAIQRGKAISLGGIPGEPIPACVACHGPSPVPHNPAFPVIAGQHADYLRAQLVLFKKDHRGGSQYSHLMQEVVRQMSSEQMRDVALYFASIPVEAASAEAQLDVPRRESTDERDRASH